RMAAVYRQGCSLPANLSRTAARRWCAVEIACSDAARCVRSPERVSLASAASPGSCSNLGKRDRPVARLEGIGRRESGQLSHCATWLHWTLLTNSHPATLSKSRIKIQDWHNQALL